RRHTRFSRDWSSDVCSSDLRPRRTPGTSMAVSLAVVAGDCCQAAKSGGMPKTVGLVTVVAVAVGGAGAASGSGARASGPLQAVASRQHRTRRMRDVARLMRYADVESAA